MIDGYEIIPGILPHAECERLTEQLRDTSRSRAGARHLMSHPSVVAVAHDRRLTAIAGAALGRNAVPFRATLFEKTGAKNWLIAWHQDTALPLRAKFDSPDWGPWSIKNGIDYAHAPAWALDRVVALRVHLDASTSENGPLRVIPGSHRRGVLSDADVLDFVRAHREVECPVSRGCVLAMRPLLIHASSKCASDEPRRVLHIEYAESLTLAAGMELAIA